LLEALTININFSSLKSVEPFHYYSLHFDICLIIRAISAPTSTHKGREQGCGRHGGQPVFGITNKPKPAEPFMAYFFVRPFSVSFPSPSFQSPLYQRSFRGYIHNSSSKMASSQQDKSVLGMPVSTTQVFSNLPAPDSEEHPGKSVLKMALEISENASRVS
jgi:hypothetical protein